MDFFQFFFFQFFNVDFVLKLGIVQVEVVEQVDVQQNDQVVQQDGLLGMLGWGFYGDFQLGGFWVLQFIVVGFFEQEGVGVFFEVSIGC